MAVHPAHIFTHRPPHNQPHNQLNRFGAKLAYHVAEHDADIYKHFMAPLEAKQNAYAVDYVPVAKDATRESLVDRILDSGLWMVGTVDDVRDQFVAQWQKLPAEYCTLIFHYAQEPKESVIASLEIFMREIKPALDEITEAAHGSAVATAS